MSLPAPADFQLHTNHQGIMEFIYELRRQVYVKDRFRGRGTLAKPNLYINLDPIEIIDLEGALLLSAELDRIRRVLGMRALMDDEGWNPSVRIMLNGLGLYRVMEAGRVRGQEPISDLAESAEKLGLSIVPFLSCAEADPRKAQELRTALYERCAPGGDETEIAVYGALVEAFNNAIAHAYIDDVPGDGLPRVRRWWAGALVDRRQGYLYLVVYDLGVGIPATLPHRNWWNLLALQLPELNDAAVIEGALKHGRSGVSDHALFGTEPDGRGNGLGTMCALADTFEEADVRFTSLKGDVLYVKGGSMERTTLPARFCGTMIRWRTKIRASKEL